MNNIGRRTFCSGVLASAIAAPSFSCKAGAAIGTAATISSLHLPATLTSFKTTGFHTSGDLGNATYIRAANAAEPHLSLVSADGARWNISDARLRPEMFGAKADGITDCTAAINQALSIGKPVDLSPGTYLISRTLIADRKTGNGDQLIEIAGAGIQRTKIINANFTKCLQIFGSDRQGSPIWLHDFTIGRDNVEQFTGTLGQHSVEVNKGSSVLISDVEEFGAIGMGIALIFCRQFEIKNCHVHDHKNGSKVTSGSDGIHIYMCPGPGKVHHNRVQNVGDDGISHGSYRRDAETKDIETYENQLENIAGSIKVYGNARNINIHNNTVNGGFLAGACIWDDRNAENSYDVENIKITDNTFVGCGSPGASGGVYLAQTSGDGTQEFRDILIARNKIKNCARGISLFSARDTKKSRRVVIEQNEISDSKLEGMLINSAYDDLRVIDNSIENSGTHGIFFQSQHEGNFTFRNNRIRGVWNRRENSPRQYGAIWLVGSATANYTVEGNVITDFDDKADKSWAIYAKGDLSAEKLLQNNTIDSKATLGVTAKP